MKKLAFFIIVSLSCCFLARTPLTLASAEEPDYAALHIMQVENHAVIPDMVTAQYLVGDDPNPGDIAATLDELRSLAVSIVGGYDNDYDKARAISAWVADNLHYDRHARDTDVNFETIALKNVIQTRKTVCSGYANLTAALLAAAGMKSVTVLGNTSFDESNPTGNPHEWTAFWYVAENRWVLLDSGWDSFNYYDGEYVKIDSRTKHFDLSAEGFSHTHRARKAEFRDWFAVSDSDMQLETVAESAEFTAAVKEKARVRNDSESQAQSESAGAAISVFAFIVIAVIVFVLFFVAGIVFAVLKKKK